MTINSITINNFQSYYSEETIEFGKGLNLIIGNGGKGKSKLFNAFYWVLFGDIYITSEGWCSTAGLPGSSRNSLHRYEFINKRALSEAKVGDVVPCSVILELTDDKKNQFRIERSVSAKRQDSDNWDEVAAWSVSDENIKVTFETRTGTKTVIDDIAEGKIAELFPEGIRGYIWFQGESLDTLIDFRKKENLKDAVNHISYYPYYEKLSEIITLAKRKIEKAESKHLTEANRQNVEATNLIRTMEFLRGRIETEEATKKKIESVIEQIQIALAEDEGKISGLAGFTGLVKEYEECEKAIADINNQLTNLDNRQRELLPSLWILRGVDPMIEKCKDIIKSHVEEEYTAPEMKYLDNPSRAKLEEILENKVCYVCGSRVDSEHHEAVEYIKNRLRLQDEYLREMEEYKSNIEQSKQFNMFVGKIQDYPDSLLVSLRQIDKQYGDLEDKIESLIAKRKRIQEKKHGLDERMEEVKRRYNVDPRREAAQAPVLNSNIKASRSNLDKQQSLLRASVASIAKYKSELEGAEKEYSKVATASQVSRVPETEWKNISTFLEAICSSVQEKARVDLLRKIEERSNQFYEKFTEHDRGYKGMVEIDDDYSIKFDAGLNTSHEDRKKMSIINALLSLNQEAIGTYYPFISDAPTSSFDPDTTHKYLMGIKDIFGQSIIMTKDVVIDSDNYMELFNDKNISRIFLLTSNTFGKADGEPQINEVATKVERLK
jgi:DNA sulfur modification protein DndD